MRGLHSADPQCAVCTHPEGIRTVAAHEFGDHVPPAYPNPHDITGNGQWFHGTNYDPKLGGFQTADERGEDDDGGWRHWNTHLGTHFTSQYMTAKNFAKGIRYSPAHDQAHARIAHASLHMEQPMHYPSEHDMSRDAFKWGRKNGFQDYDRGEEFEEDEEDHRWLNKSMHESGDHEDWIRGHPRVHELAHGFKKHLQDQGFDGITYGNEHEKPYGHLSAIAFKETPVKVNHWDYLHPQQKTAMGMAGPDYDNLTFKKGLDEDFGHNRGGDPDAAREVGDYAIHAIHPEHGVVGKLTYADMTHPEWTGYPARALHINMLRVHPDHRRRGIASQLMRHLEETHPDVPIDHGTRTRMGEQWGRHMYGRESQPGRATMWDQDENKEVPIHYEADWTLNGKPWNFKTKKFLRPQRKKVDAFLKQAEIPQPHSRDELIAHAEGHQTLYKPAGEEHDRSYGEGLCGAHAAQLEAERRTQFRDLGIHGMDEGERPEHRWNSVGKGSCGTCTRNQNEWRNKLPGQYGAPLDGPRMSPERRPRTFNPKNQVPFDPNMFHGLASRQPERKAARNADGDEYPDDNIWYHKSHSPVWTPKPEHALHVGTAHAATYMEDQPQEGQREYLHRFRYHGQAYNDPGGKVLHDGPTFDQVANHAYHEAFGRDASRSHSDPMDDHGMESIDIGRQLGHHSEDTHAMIDRHVQAAKRGLGIHYLNSHEGDRPTVSLVAPSSHFEHLGVEPITDEHRQRYARLDLHQVRVLNPTSGHDPYLFDGDTLKPEVRKTLIARWRNFCAQHQLRDWMGWAQLYFTGGEASEWSGPGSNPNGDFDMQVGIDFDDFREANPQFSSQSNEAISMALNAMFWINANDHHFKIGDRDFDLTWYSNPAVNPDIKKINPYAAYDVLGDKWAVHPKSYKQAPHLPSAVRKALEGAETYAREVLSLPEPQRTREAAALFESWHNDRSKAFEPGGQGVFDYANLRMKALEATGVWQQLQDAANRLRPRTAAYPHDEASGEQAVRDKSKWPPYLYEKLDPEGYGTHPANVSRSNVRGPVGTHEDAKAMGWVGPFFHGTTKRRAQEIRRNGFRQPRMHDWEMSLAGNAEEVDFGHTHRTYFARTHEDAMRFATHNGYRPDGDVVQAYIHPDHVETESGGGFMPSVQCRDVAKIMAVRDKPDLSKDANRLHPRAATVMTEHRLWGKGLDSLFPSDEDGPKSSAPAPWQAAGQRKDVHTYDKELVGRSITHPHEFPVEEVDPRDLRATQPKVIRAGVKHYMEGGEGTYGENNGGDHRLGNDVPRIYHREDGQKIILSGHHRAAAALLKGEKLRAIVIHGGWGSARNAA